MRFVPISQLSTKNTNLIFDELPLRVTSMNIIVRLLPIINAIAGPPRLAEASLTSDCLLHACCSIDGGAALSEGVRKLRELGGEGRQGGG